MHEYKFEAKVRRTVIDQIFLKVNANTYQEALDKAEATLEVFPNISSEPDVPFCYINSREFEGVADIIEIDEVMETDSA